MDEVVDIRCGRGLTPLHPGEVDVAVVAGVGARTALQIVEDAAQHGVRWLVLQCMQRDALVEPWLQTRGWVVRATATAVQRGRSYPTRVVEVSA